MATLLDEKEIDQPSLTLFFSEGAPLNCKTCLISDAMWLILRFPHSDSKCIMALFQSHNEDCSLILIIHHICKGSFGVFGTLIVVL